MAEENGFKKFDERNSNPDKARHGSEKDFEPQERESDDLDMM